MSEIPTSPHSSETAEAISRPSGRLRALIRLMRPRQWSKNLLVFAALVFANQLFVPTSVALSLLGFIAFCLASSSVYVVNDLMDVERDRQHPEKRHRPIASGEVSPAVALVLAALLTAGSLAIALWIGWKFAAAIGVYVALVHFYSMAGKHVVILDTMIVAAGFVIRAVGGALAISVRVSEWFVLCTFFAALFLALSKRRAELLAQHTDSSQTRSVLEQYTESTLAAYTSTAIAATTISFGLYVINSAHTFPLLPGTVPFVLYAVFRYHHLVETAGMGEKPEDVFLRDRPFQLCVVAFAIASLAAVYLGA